MSEKSVFRYASQSEEKLGGSDRLVLKNQERAEARRRARQIVASKTGAASSRPGPVQGTTKSSNLQPRKKQELFAGKIPSSASQRSRKRGRTLEDINATAPAAKITKELLPTTSVDVTPKLDRYGRSLPKRMKLWRYNGTDSAAPTREAIDHSFEQHVMQAIFAHVDPAVLQTNAEIQTEDSLSASLFNVIRQMANDDDAAIDLDEADFEALYDPGKLQVFNANHPARLLVNIADELNKPLRDALQNPAKRTSLERLFQSRQTVVFACQQCGEVGSWKTDAWTLSMTCHESLQDLTKPSRKFFFQCPGCCKPCDDHA